MNNEELKLGSITEIWKSGPEWAKYSAYLDTMEPEAIDSEGEPMKLSRYAHFLRLYVDLYHQEKLLIEKRDPKAKEILKKSVLDIKSDPEDFFGVERCLKCINVGIRKQVLENVRKVKKNEVQGGAWVYEPAYSPVLDKLNYLLGPYNEYRQIQELSKT